MCNDDDSPESGHDSLLKLFSQPWFRRELRLPSAAEMTGEAADAVVLTAAATLTAGYWAACSSDREHCPSFNTTDFLDTFWKFYNEIAAGPRARRR